MTEGEIHDAPNQQVVRPDGSHPADEGEGGSWHPEAGQPEDTKAEPKAKAKAKAAEPKAKDDEDE